MNPQITVLLPPIALMAQRCSSCEKCNLRAVSDVVAIGDAAQNQRASQLLATSTVVCQGRQQQPLKQQAKIAREETPVP